MGAWQAFRTGFRRTSRYWQIWLVLYAANLLSALALVLLPALSLVSDPGHRPAMRQLADGLDAWYILELLMSSSTMAALGQGGPQPELAPILQQALVLGAITGLALPWLAWLPSAFLSGGLLLIYAESPLPFRWRRFLWGCWHWFGSFLLLGVVQALGLVVALVPAALLAVVAASVSAWLLYLVLAALGMWIVVWLVLMEYSRIEAVVGGSQNAVRAWGRAVRFVFRHPLPVTGLYGLMLLLAALLHALYRLGLMPNLNLSWWPIVLVVQQSFILVRLGLRLVRLAGGVALVSKAGPTAAGARGAGSTDLKMT